MLDLSMFCVVLLISGSYHLYGSVVVLFLGDGLLQDLLNSGAVVLFSEKCHSSSGSRFFVLYRPFDSHATV